MKIVSLICFSALLYSVYQLVTFDNFANGGVVYPIHELIQTFFLFVCLFLSLGLHKDN